MNSNNINNSMSNRFNAFNNSAYTRMMNLEKKVLNLEKKLMASKKEYNSIKDRNEYVEKILKNYEKKYSGLFNFFEDCLELFFNDEELVNPLMDSSNVLKQSQSGSNNINNVNLKFYLGNKKNYLNEGEGGSFSGRKNSFEKMTNSMDNINKKDNFLPNIPNNIYGK